MRRYMYIVRYTCYVGAYVYLRVYICKKVKSVCMQVGGKAGR